MCGIAGIYDPKGVRRDYLERMSDALAHRGPDAFGIHVDGSFGLAHRRLSIIDISASADQPMRSACGRYHIVFNGEVYNFKDVAKDLGIKLRTSSDTEVVLEAFAQWGPDMVQRLNGMFAMAILDADEQKLYFFRDRMGIKPLFIYRNDGILAFGSELKALTVLKQKLRFSVNREAVPYFLHLGYVPQPMTIYSEVQKFPAGHWAVFDGQSLTSTCYWNPETKVSKTLLTDEHEAKVKLEELLQKSVSRRLMSDVPFGTFLSGGIDSSLVTALAQKSTSENLKTFSLGFEDSSYDESFHARKVAEHLGTEHHTYTVTEKDALELATEILPQYDEPYADSSAIPTMLVSKMARQEVTMTLSGDGGDELFMGYGAYRWAQRLSNPMMHALRWPLAFGLSFGTDRLRRVSKILKYGKSDNLAAHIFSQEQYLFARSEIDRLIGRQHIPMRFPKTNVPDGRTMTAAELQALFDLQYYLKDDLLVKVDRASMRYSLETRVPLLDHHIVEFSLNLDPNLKMRNGCAKYLLKKILYEHVPKQLFDRPKWGFSVPLAKWLHGSLSFLIDEFLSEEAVNRAGLVKWSEVEGYVRQFRSGQQHLYNRVWLLIILHQWAALNHQML